MSNNVLRVRPRRTASAFLAAVVGGVLVVGVTAPGAQAAPADGLRGAWLMDEGSGSVVGDSSGAGHNGATRGAVSWVSGVEKTALSLGAGGSALIPDAPTLDLSGPMTVAAWVRPAEARTQYVVKKAAQNATDGFELGLASGGQAFFRVNQTTSGDTYRATATSPLANGNWAHLVGTFDGTTMRIYVDGAERAAVAGPAAIGVNDLGLAIGGEPGGSRTLNGTVDSVYLYDRALTAAEVADLGSADPGGNAVTVTPTAVSFADNDGTATDTYTIPAVTGVEYVLGGSVRAAGTYPGTGTVTVTARATAGHRIAAGAATRWSHPFSAAVQAQPVFGFFLSDAWTSGVANQVFQYGNPDDQVLTGDWNGDKKDTITVRRGNVFYARNTNTTGPADTVLAYGNPGDDILVGDWNGDGVDTFAVRRGNEFHIRNSNTSGRADQVVHYGNPGDQVLVGDWNGDGKDTLTVRRGNVYYVKNTMSSGTADNVIAYGNPGDITIVGDWDGNGTDTLGVRRGIQYHLKNAISTGTADRVFAYGNPDDEILVGDWNGDNTDTLGIRRTP
ncbi:LamG domain-containing protein [Georgenia sp. SYP-B2076]|uniref:LamG domain-containing protein n=1 Tax=Georgenia sp. SYP-B2076 TaxID=2495881 RepID=UPI000F8F32AC|nr:LamG domain-containing protein [Georgenia sp. SYP-B2076]